MEDIWMPIPKPPYDECYLISSTGKIKSIDRWVNSKNGSKAFRAGKLKKIQHRGNGYLSTTLSYRQKTLTINIHRILAEVFIPNPNNMPCVNHIDGNKLNNSLDNLEWCDYSHNNQHAVDTGLNYAVGEMQWNSTIAENVVRDLRIQYKNGTRICDLVKIFDLNHSTIWSIVHYISRRHDGLI